MFRKHTFSRPNVMFMYLLKTLLSYDSRIFTNEESPAFSAFIIATENSLSRIHRIVVRMKRFPVEQSEYSGDNAEYHTDRNPYTAIIRVN